MKLNAFLYVTSIILFASCGSLRQEVEPKGIAQEPEKLVVACFISPQDTVLVARVTRSLPVLGTGNQAYPDIPDAVVTLSDGSRSVRLKPKSYQNGGYGFPTLSYEVRSHELPIVVGKTYTLTVQVPDGRSVTASCTVPGPVALQEVLLDSGIVNEFGRSRKEYYVRLRWKDQAGQVNYYRATGDNEFSIRNTIRTSPNSPPRDTVIRMRGSWGAPFVTDLNRDGQEIVSARARLAIYYSWVNGEQQATRVTGQLNAYLLNIDENYYRHHEATKRQSQVRDNPFAEPVLIPSNIQGGLGCFGAYNRSTWSATLR